MADKLKELSNELSKIAKYISDFDNAVGVLESRLINLEVKLRCPVRIDFDKDLDLEPELEYTTRNCNLFCNLTKE